MDAIQLVFPILVLVFFGATMAAAMLTRTVRGYACRHGWTSVPASHHIHHSRIPRLGGVAIVLTFLLLYSLGWIVAPDLEWRLQLAVIIPGTLLTVVGLIDDFRPLPARFKFLCQVSAGLILFLGHVRLVEPSAINIHLGSVDLGVGASLVATVGWVVLITNAFNLVDGLDGLAAGSALFSILTLCILAAGGHYWAVMYSTLVLGGAVLGFLRYNFYPASIFLGDCGSLFLGFLLSGMALLPKRTAAPTLVAVAIPLLSFGMPLVETAISVVRRFMSGKPLFAPDREHIHHRLLKMGFSQRKAVILLYGGCAAFALLHLFLRSPNRPLVGFVLIIAGAVFLLGIGRLGYPEFAELTRLAQRTLEQKKIIANDIAIRKIAEKLYTCQAWSGVRDALDELLLLGEFDSYQLVLGDSTILSREAHEKPLAARVNRARLSKKLRHSDLPSFGFTFDLIGDRSRLTGQFSLHRTGRERSILVDVNLLSGKLQPALSAACGRLAVTVEPAKLRAGTAPPYLVHGIRSPQMPPPD